MFTVHCSQQHGVPTGDSALPGPICLVRLRFKHNSELCHKQKFSDDTVKVGCIKNGKEEKYRSLIEDFLKWCISDHLQLNTMKTKEMVLNFSQTWPRSHPQPVLIKGVLCFTRLSSLASTSVSSWAGGAALGSGMPHGWITHTVFCFIYFFFFLNIAMNLLVKQMYYLWQITLINFRCIFSSTLLLRLVENRWESVLIMLHAPDRCAPKCLGLCGWIGSVPSVCF